MRILVPFAFAAALSAGQPSFSVFNGNTGNPAKIVADRPPDGGATTAGWGTLGHSEATIRQIIANNKMVIRQMDRSGVSVARFDLFLFTDALPIQERSIKVEGNCLDKRTIGLIAQLKPGDRIMFSNIALLNADSTARYAQDFAIDIK